MIKKLTPNPKLSEKEQAVFDAVKRLYEASERDMGQWMWQHHVQWVAEKAAELAEKYEANVEKTRVGALLHDLGDVWLERDDPEFDARSRDEAEHILTAAGFDVADVQEILDDIIEPHSCYPDNLPKTIEGQCLATADALFHLMTDFFEHFQEMGIPKGKNSADWLVWAAEKLERDIHVKIFFDQEQELARPFYEELRQKLEQLEEAQLRIKEDKFYKNN